MAERLKQVTSHLTNSFPKGLLAGEVAIITGSAQGIGRSAALLFAAEGAKVIVSDIDEKKAAIVVKEITDAGGEAFAICGDVTAEDFPKKLIGGTIEKYGKINHIVNNAGFTADKMIHTMSDSMFELMLKVHNTAPFRIIREASPYMRAKPGTPESKENRTITNISSTSARGNVGQVNYAVAKAGVVGLTKTVAKEWGPFGVRCNTIAYGFIQTRLTAAKELGESITVGGVSIALGIPQAPGGDPNKSSGATRIPDIPLGRPGTADEAAAAMLFLASPLSAYISGHTLDVTGGRGI